MNDAYKATIEWIREDYDTDPFRFLIEAMAWAISIGCALGMAFTVPNPPLHILYPVWVTGCIMYCWCAHSRHSFGMLANYVLLTIIDGIGLVRLFIN